MSNFPMFPSYSKLFVPKVLTNFIQVLVNNAQYRISYIILLVVL